MDINNGAKAQKVAPELFKTRPRFPCTFSIVKCLAFLSKPPLLLDPTPNGRFIVQFHARY